MRLVLLSAFPAALVEGFALNGAVIDAAAPPRAPAVCASAASPGPNRRQALSAAFAAATSSTVFSAAADAADELKRPNVEISGYYNDPTHPRGYRQIVVKGSSNQVSVVGADDKFESSWKLQSIVSGSDITLQLEPNGKVQPPSGVQTVKRTDGSTQRIFKGRYNPTPPAGIEWPDGNKWTKADGDVFIF